MRPSDAPPPRRNRARATPAILAILLAGILALPPAAGAGKGRGRELKALDAGAGLRLFAQFEHAAFAGATTADRQSEWPESAGSQKVFLRKNQREALYLRPPGAIRYRLRLGQATELRFAVGISPTARSVPFEVAIEAGGDRRIVDTFQVESPGNWLERRVDLSEWSGRTVLLELVNPGAPAGSVAFWADPRITKAPPPGPNVVIYLIDTLRADHLGAYGYDRPTSPIIDALAKSGVLFRRAYAQDTRTVGSAPSLLASIDPVSHGISQYGDKIADSVTTLAEVFRDAGISTGSFVTNLNAGHLPGLDRGFEHFHDAIKTLNDPEALRSYPREAFLHWLDTRGEERFFAYIHTAEPHRPYIPPAPFDTMFDSGYEGPITGFFEGPNGYEQAKRPEDVEHVIALYDGEIRFADAAFGRMLQDLETRNLLKNTLVVLLSDHGEEFLDHGGWNHGNTLYEELLRIPLVFAGPGVPSGGKHIEAPVQLIDVAPTVLELAGLSRPASFQGDSLATLMKGGNRRRFLDRPIFVHASKAPRKTAVIHGRWKCILNTGGELELYDLVADPGEKNNIAEDRVETSAALLAMLRAWLDERPTNPEDADPVEITEEELQRLRTLGYLP